MAKTPIEEIKFRQGKEYEYWTQQKITEPRKMKEKLEQELNIEVSVKTVREDLKDLEKQGKIKIITKEQKTERRREIVKKLYNEKGLTGEELRQETNKELEDVFGIPFSFSMTVIEKDIQYFREKGELNEQAKEQKMEEKHLAELEEKLKAVEKWTKNGKTIEQIAEKVGIQTDTVKKYKKILKEQGRLTGKERPKRQATIKKEKRMKRVDKLDDGQKTEMQMAEIEGVSRTTIARDKKRLKEKTLRKYLSENRKKQTRRKSKIRTEQIEKLCKNFEGQDKYIEKFDDYILDCRDKLEKGIFGKEELSTVKNIITVAEEYRYIAFYAKAGVKIEEFEEVLKVLRNQTTNEFLTKEQRAEMRNLSKEVQQLNQSYKARIMLENGAGIEETMKYTRLLETQVQAINNKIIQKKKGTRKKEGKDDGDEPEIA